MIWTVKGYDYYFQLNDEEDVVWNLHWIFTNGDYRSYGTEEIATDDLSEFIELEQVTQADLVRWLFTSLGEEKDRIEANGAAHEAPNGSLVITEVNQ